MQLIKKILFLVLRTLRMNKPIISNALNKNIKLTVKLCIWQNKVLFTFENLFYSSRFVYL